MSDTSNIIQLVKPKREGVPEFITPKDIQDMTDEQLDNLVAAIRTRRSNSFLIYAQTKRDKEALSTVKDVERIEKKCVQIIKAIDKIDGYLEKLETNIAELRGLRLQVGLPIL